MYRLLATAVIVCVLAACTQVTTQVTKQVTTYQASLYRSEGGVPHIISPDIASLAYGTGYAVAEDNLCELARSFLMLDARLSENFGPDDGNLESDLFYQLMKDLGQYDQVADAAFEALFRGYAAGYNRYLRDTGVNNLPDPSCRGAHWVHEILPSDSRNAHLNPFFLGAFRDMVVAARPPVSGGAANLTTDLTTDLITDFITDFITTAEIDMPMHALMMDGNPDDKGSNGVAIGRRGAASGTALLFANPHLKWQPDVRFYPMHHIIPGKMNLLGANIIDRASVGVGTNGHIAWTNTVSTAKRFSFYQLTLVPGDPTSYLYDGEPRRMQKRRVTVRVRNDDGSFSQQSQDFYSSQHGPLIGNFPWDQNTAFALRIADEKNRAVNGATSAQYESETVHELKAVHNKYQYMTVNLIAADKNGEVLYGDLGPVPNLTDEQLADCSVFDGRALDGSRSECEWQDDPTAADAGILPPDQQPSLIRDDFVTNSNDSYWLANPAEPIAAVPAIHGNIGTERTLRTRSGLKMVQARLAGTDGRDGKGFTLDNLLDVLMSNENMTGQLIRDDLVTLCRKQSSVELADASVVKLGEACDVLADWDLHANLDSRGAHLFREFIREASTLAGPTNWPRILPTSLNARVPFDIERPLETPFGLDVHNNPNAMLALASAVQRLRSAGIALDTRLGEIQGVTRNGDFIPLHGGVELEGVFNKMEFSFEGAAGYPDVTGASGSWIMATELRPSGPRVKAILAYSISGNAESEHYADMTRLLSKKRFLEIPYQQKDVRERAALQIQLTEGASDCNGAGWQKFSTHAFVDKQSCNDYFGDLNGRRLTSFDSDTR